MNPALCLLLGIVLAVIPAAAQVGVDYDHAVDFSRYRTFGFSPGRIVPGPNLAATDSTLLNLVVRDAVAMRLEAKGFTPSAERPDLTATFVAGARDKQQIERFVSGPAGKGMSLGNPGGRYYAPSGWWGDSWESWWVNEYEQGTLILDLYDTRTGELVWRAYLEVDINTNNDTKLVNRQIAKALKHFPPGGKAR